VRLVFWVIFLLLALNIALWGGLALAPPDKIGNVPFLAILVFDLHIAAYLGWLSFKDVRQPVVTEKI